MDKPGYYIEASIDIPRQLTDAISDFIIENICSGLILEEEDTSEITRIKFYVAENHDKEFRRQLSEYFEQLNERSDIPIVMPQISERIVKNVEWEEQYKASVIAVVVAGDVSVRPPWQEKPDGVVFDIVIEPKMAFGTGSHETTRGCLEAIRHNFQRGMRFLDLGCGSGVLSILADKMGAEYIKAVDYDITAVENCQENFLINDVMTAHDIIHGSIDEIRADAPYEFICANIIKSTILAMLPTLNALTASSGILVLSGLLVQDTTEILRSLERLGLTNISVIEDNEWRTLVITKD